MNKQFELFCQFFHARGIEATIAYQYFKHGDDELALCSTAFNSKIANSAYSLHESTAHHFIFVGEWNIEKTWHKHWKASPIVSAFVKIPFNGRNSILTPLAGGSLSIQF